MNAIKETYPDTIVNTLKTRKNQSSIQITNDQPAFKTRKPSSKTKVFEL
jgi:meiotically up-regulated gene 157 (Mug157) protein